MTKLEQLNQEAKERHEHHAVLLAIQGVIATKSGKDFIKYLFKSFEVGEAPPLGISGEFLHDKLGFLRAGNSIFKIVAEASPEFAGVTLAQIEKEKHVEKLEYTQA